MSRNPSTTSTFFLVVWAAILPYRLSGAPIKPSFDSYRITFNQPSLGGRSEFIFSTNNRRDPRDDIEIPSNNMSRVSIEVSAGGVEEKFSFNIENVYSGDKQRFVDGKFEMTLFTDCRGSVDEVLAFNGINKLFSAKYLLQYGRNCSESDRLNLRDAYAAGRNEFLSMNRNLLR